MKNASDMNDACDATTVTEKITDVVALQHWLQYVQGVVVCWCCTCCRHTIKMKTALKYLQGCLNCKTDIENLTSTVRNHERKTMSNLLVMLD